MSKKKKIFSNVDENIILESAAQEKEAKNDFDKENTATDFLKNLKSAIEGLCYMSETDAEIKVFAGKKADKVSKDVLINQINASSNVLVEEKTAEDFFKSLTEIQDWFGEEETAAAEKFSKLKSLLEENLKDLKVFKVGQIELEIYAVGLDSRGFLTGIMTKAVET